MSARDDLAALLEPLIDGGKLDRTMALARIPAQLLSLSARERRELAVLVAERAAPHLVSRIKSHTGADLTTQQLRSVAGMMAELDQRQLREVLWELRDPQLRTQRMADAARAVAEMAEDDPTIDATVDGGERAELDTHLADLHRHLDRLEELDEEAPPRTLHDAAPPGEGPPIVEAEPPVDDPVTADQRISGPGVPPPSAPPPEEPSSPSAPPPEEPSPPDGASRDEPSPPDGAPPAPGPLPGATVGPDRVGARRQPEGARPAPPEPEGAGAGPESIGPRPAPPDTEADVAPESIGARPAPPDTATEAASAGRAMADRDAPRPHAVPTATLDPGWVATAAARDILDRVAALGRPTGTASDLDVPAVVQAIPDGWLRRRVLDRLTAQGHVGRRHASGVVGLLERHGDRVWIAASLLEHDVLDPEELEGLVGERAAARLRRRHGV